VKPAGTVGDGIAVLAKRRTAKNPATRARVIGANARPGIVRTPQMDSTSGVDYG
jgi:hypothetical protein